MSSLNLVKYYIRYVLSEGGLKAPELTAATRLSPQLVQQAVEIYKQIIADWNEYLEAIGQEPVVAVRPVGSTAYYLQDIEENEDVIYGDLDYLIQFPFDQDQTGPSMSDTDRKKIENQTQRNYESYLEGWLKQSPPSSVAVDATLKSSPTILIVQLPGGEYVQVDMIVTWPKYSEWMKGRYTPQRGVKGYTLGNLYGALGDVLVLSIGKEGVLMRTQQGKRVPGRIRKDIVVKNISTDPSNFLVDIVRELVGKDAEIDPALKKFPGVNPDNVKISHVAQGVKGLLDTLIHHGIAQQDIKDQFLRRFKEKLNLNVRKKQKMGLPHDSAEKLFQLNEKVYSLVSTLVQA